jgi:hypothetical protein
MPLVPRPKPPREMLPLLPKLPLLLLLPELNEGRLLVMLLKCGAAE